MGLEEIQSKFEAVVAQMEEPKRTQELVRLMNILKSQYGTMLIWQEGKEPSRLYSPEVQLYREISMA